MPVTLTIKQVPDRVAERLRARAAGSHRSLQGELMAILEAAVNEAPLAAAEREPPAYGSATQKARGVDARRPPKERKLTLAEVWDMGRRMGLSSPPESVEIIRKTRDERYRR
jgi:plasmid stability protein